MKRVLTFAALATILASCSTKEEGATGPMPVTIDPTITRVTEVDFETNDAIGVNISTAQGAFVTNRKFIFNDEKKFVGEETLIWYEDVNAPATFFAYYPHTEQNPAEFTVTANQNGDGYFASDLLTASKEGVYPQKAPVSLTFQHKMARLILTVVNDTDFPVTDLVVTGAIGSATIDGTKNTVTVKSDAAAVDITAREVTPGVKYYALVVPQSAKLSVTVTTAEGTRSQSYTETELVGGKSYPMTVRVMPANMELAMEGPIDAWEEASEIPTEGQGSSEPATLEYGGVKYKIVTLKTGQTWMAENLRYVPDGKTPSSDPTDKNGVWNPCDLNSTVDPSLVEKNGLLYSYPILLGIEGGELTAENYNQYEGAQGICPDGWHIPTEADWSLLMAANSPYYDSEQQSAAIEKLNADGFNFYGCGYIMCSGSAGTPKYLANVSAQDDTAYGMGCYPTSTAQSITYNTADDPSSGIKNIMYRIGMITYNAKYNRVTVSNQSGYGGYPVRCIKDAE